VGLGSGVSSSTFTTTNYIELNDGGIYNVGYSQNQASSIIITSLGATISYPAQNLVYTGSTTKYPIVIFPAKMGNPAVNISNFLSTSNYSVTALAFGLNNTPGQTKITYSITQEVIGSGKVILKGIGEVRALLIKDALTERTNYFLGGSPAPPALLSNLGVTDGETATSTTYRFVGEGLGTIGFIEVNASGNITATNFRKG
jgi:hypothetical protein